jgi:hypothetical protein
MNRAEDILNFSGLIFPDVFFVDFERKPAQLMPYN